MTIVGDLAVGQKIIFGKHQVNNEVPEPITWIIAGKNLPTSGGTPANSTTLVTERIIDMRQYDNKEPDNIDGDIQMYGDSRWDRSNIRKWLNSSDQTNWYTSTYQYDAKPDWVEGTNVTGYTHRPGFLYNFNTLERNIILTTDVKYRHNQPLSNSGSIRTVQDKIFLLSAYEVGFSDSTGGPEGNILPYFNSNVRRWTKLTQQIITHCLYPLNTATHINRNWALRSSYGNSVSTLMVVRADGTINIIVPSEQVFPIRPGCNISNTTEVRQISSDTWGLVLSVPSVINISYNDIELTDNENIGDRTAGFSFSYTVTNTTPANIKIDIDGNVLEDNTNLEYTNNAYTGTFTISPEIYNSLSFDDNKTINVIAYDEYNTVTKSFKFNKIRLGDPDTKYVLSDLDIGTAVKFGKYQVNTETAEDITWTIINKTDDQITLLTDKVIDYLSIDGKEILNPTGSIQTGGNNRYVYSNINQWLNKSGSDWYIPYHTEDAPPSITNVTSSPYNTKPGFLTNFTQNEINNIKYTSIRSAKNSVEYEDFDTKIFLLSSNQVGVPTNVGENTVYSSKFSNDASRVVTATQQSITNSSFTGKPADTTTNTTWWLRTPDSASSNNTKYVTTTGTTANAITNTVAGIRPACNVTPDMAVTFQDGIYSINAEETVRIIVDKRELGDKYDPFTLDYIIHDINNNPATLTISIDGTLLHTITPILDTLYTLDINANTFNNLDEGNHNIVFNVNSGDTIMSVSFKKIDRVETSPINSINTIIKKRNEDNTYTAVFPSTLSNYVYTDISKNETLNDTINDIIIKPIKLWTHRFSNNNYINDIFYNEDTLYVSGSNNTGVKSFNTDNGNFISNIFTDYANIPSVRTDIGNTHIFVANNNIIYKYNNYLNNPALIESYTHTGGNISSFDVDISGNGYFGTTDGKLVTLDSYGNHVVTATSAGNTNITDVYINGEYVYMIFNNEKIGRSLINSSTITIVVDSTDTINNIILNENRLYIAITTDTNIEIRSYDLNDFTSFVEVLNIDKGLLSIKDLKISYDNKLFALFNNKLSIYDEIKVRNIELISDAPQEIITYSNSLVNEINFDSNTVCMDIDYHNHPIIGFENGEICKYTLYRFESIPSMTRMMNYQINTSDWIESYDNVIGQVYKTTIRNTSINSSSFVNIDISDLQSLYYANEAGIKSIVEENDGEAYIYSASIPSGPIKVDITINN